MQWFIFFLTLPHLKPDSLEPVWPAIESIFDAGRLASTLVILGLYIFKNRLPSKPVWILALMEGWLLFSTAVNKGNLRDAVMTFIAVLVTVCIVDLFSIWPVQLIRSLMLNLEWLIYGNLLSILLTYPQGLYINQPYFNSCYFLGYHNSFFQYVLLAICVACLYAHLEKRKIRAACLIAASYACVLITWSATSVAALMLVTALLLLPSTLRRFITFPGVFAAAMIGNLSITVFRVMDRVPWAAWFIKAVLKKQTTLTGRIYIWDQFYKCFAQHPLLGHGVGSHLQFSTAPVGAHNQYFELLLTGGILTLVLFMLFTFATGERLIRYRDRASSYIFLSILAGLYIIFIAEAYLTPTVFMLMTLPYYVNKFEGVSAPHRRKLRIVIRQSRLVPSQKSS